MEEILLVLLIVILFASPVLAIVFLCLFLAERSRRKWYAYKVSDLEKELKKLKDGETEVPEAPAPKPAPAPVPAAPKPAPAPAAPAPAVPKPVPAPAPVPAAKPQEPKQHKISSINVTFGVGVLLLTAVSAFFISMSWASFSAAARIGVLGAVLAVVFFLSFLAGKILKLPQTGYAFYCVGSFMVPIIVIGGAALGIFGSAFSLASDAPLIFIVAAGLFALTGFIGIFIYKSAVQFSITYLGITWMTVYVFIKIFGGYMSVLPALALLGAVSALILLFKREIKGLAVYSMILSCVSQFAVFILVLSGSAARSISDYNVFSEGRIRIAAAAVLTAAAMAVLFKGVFVKLKALLPVVVIDAVIAVYVALNGIAEPVSLPVFGAIVLAYILMTAAKERTVALDIVSSFLILLFTDIGIIYARSMSFAWYSAGYILLSLIVLAGIFKSDYSYPVKRIYAPFAALFTGLALYQTGLILFEPGKKISLMLFDFAFLAVSVLSAVLGRFLRVAYKSSVRQISGAASVIGYLGSVIIFFYHYSSSLKDVHGIIYACIAAIFSAMMLVNFGGLAKDRTKVNSPFIVFSSIMVSSVPMIFLAIYNDSANTDLYSEGILAAMVALYFAAVLTTVRLLSNAEVSLFSVNRKALSAVNSVTGSLMFVIAAYNSLETDYTGVAFSINTYIMLFVAAVLCTSMILADMRVFAFIPVLVFDLALCSYISSFEFSDTVDMLIFFGAGIFFVLLGRLLFRKKAFDGFKTDSLSLSALFWLFCILDGGADCAGSMAFILLAAILAAFTGRSGKRMTRIALSLAVFSLAFALMGQELIEIPSIIESEYEILVFFIALLIVCKIVKPFSDKVMRILLIIGTALSLTVETFIVIEDENVFKTLIIGGIAIGLFIYSFVRKEKAWFIIAMVTLVGIAVFFGITFGNSGIWLVYLLAAGIILIGFAMYNEYMKRKNEASGNADSKRKRFWDEWKW